MNKQHKDLVEKHMSLSANAESLVSDDSVGTLLYLRKLKWKHWSIFQVSIPCVFVVVLWPISRGIFHIPYSFEKTFVTADLLLFGAMLFLSQAVDLYYEQKSNEKVKRDPSLDNYLLANLTMGILFLFIYGFIKSKSMQFQFPDAEIPLGNEITICVFTSIVGGVCAVVWSIFSAYKAMERVVSAERGKQ